MPVQAGGALRDASETMREQAILLSTPARRRTFEPVALEGPPNGQRGRLVAVMSDEGRLLSRATPSRPVLRDSAAGPVQAEASWRRSAVSQWRMEVPAGFARRRHVP